MVWGVKPMETWVIILGIFIILYLVISISGSKDTTEVLAKKLLIQELKKYGFNVSDFTDECLDELTQWIIKMAEFSTRSKGLHKSILDTVEGIVANIFMELKGEDDSNEDGPIYNILKKHGLVE
jgi:hypothetical protein